MESHCSLLIHYDIKGGGSAVPPTEEEIRKDLENNDTESKVRGLKSLILLILNGQAMPKLLMTVIRYCVTTRDHELKKLLSMYWEVVVKYDQFGKLLPEMILVCNAILNDLKHPNHYIRGCTLRFLCRVKDIEILQPLLSAVMENLAHSDAFVRKNAALVFFTVYQNFPDNCFNLLPDGPELILAALEAETDGTARRNLFLFLCKTDTEFALKFYQDNVSRILRFGASFHFIFLEMVRKVCRISPQKKPIFLKTIFQLLTGSSGSGALSTAISFEAAWTLISLSSAPTAIRTATTTFIALLNNSQSDNNVRLIVLERLKRLKNSNSEGFSSGAKIIQENVLDILRVLSVPDREIRKRALEIAMELVSPQNIKDIVQVLKKEILRTQDKDMDKEEAEKYRQQLIKAIHGCAVKYPAIASTVVDLLMDFLTIQSKNTDKSKVANTSGSLEVVLFVREVVETYPELRLSVMQKLISVLPDICATEVLRVSLWLLGEYSVDLGLVDEAIETIFESLGNRDFVARSETKPENSSVDKKQAVPSSTVVILPDGTYATQTGFEESAGPSENVFEGNQENILSQFAKPNDPMLRKLIVEGNYMLAVCILSSLLKLVLKLKKKQANNLTHINRIMLKSVKFGCSILNFGRASIIPVNQQIDKDSYERINLYLKMFLDSGVCSQVEQFVIGQSRKSLQGLLAEKKKKKQQEELLEEKASIIQPDQPILFRQLRTGHRLGLQGDLDDDADLSAAINTTTKSGDYASLDDVSSSLKNIYQLTGFTDPVYAEANVTVHGFDIIVDVTVINKTKQTLQDLNVELATLGDLKLMESSQSVNLSPEEVHNFKTSLKVSSTESAQIFGAIVYDDPESKFSKYVNLNHVTVDIMDYIKPATCTDDNFRKMWAEFEWENKVAVNTNFSNLYLYLNELVKITHMNCLTISDLKEKASAIDKQHLSEEKHSSDSLNFLAANLYARSIFGEDALVNVSVEQISSSRVEGFIRIRAKSQGIALSLGDRMNIKRDLN